MEVKMDNDVKYIINEAGEKEYVIISMSMYEQFMRMKTDDTFLPEKENPVADIPYTEEEAPEPDSMSVPHEDHDGETIFYFETGQVKAQGFPRGSTINPEFLILKGSSALWFNVDSMPEYARLYRDSLIENNILEKKESFYVFLQDYAFNSPNEAASAVAGKSRNGMMDWKTFDGKTLYDHGYGKQG
jgi:hypothetical protein